MQIAINGFTVLRRFGQALGPYVLLEILLPGGTLLALLLFLYRRYKLDTEKMKSRLAAATMRAFAFRRRRVGVPGRSVVRRPLPLLARSQP